MITWITHALIMLVCVGYQTWVFHLFISKDRCNVHVENNHAFVCRIADMTISLMRFTEHAVYNI